MAAMNLFASRILTGIAGLLMALGVQGGTLELDGEPLQGALIVGHADPGTTVKIDGTAVRVSDGGVFLLGFGRDAPSKARLDAVFSDGSVSHRVLKVAQRSYEVQRVDGLAPSKVSPGEKDLVRIRKETGPQSVLYYTSSGTKGLLNGAGAAFWRSYGGYTTTYGDL